jgi:photosystem II stability/assembly factor-like uncharacterized protein
LDHQVERESARKTEARGRGPGSAHDEQRRAHLARDQAAAQGYKQAFIAAKDSLGTEPDDEQRAWQRLVVDLAVEPPAIEIVWLRRNTQSASILSTFGAALKWSSPGAGRRSQPPTAIAALLCNSIKVLHLFQPYLMVEPTLPLDRILVEAAETLRCHDCINVAQGGPL